MMDNNNVLEQLKEDLQETKKRIKLFAEHGNSSDHKQIMNKYLEKKEHLETRINVLEEEMNKPAIKEKEEIKDSVMLGYFSEVEEIIGKLNYLAENGQSDAISNHSIAKCKNLAKKIESRAIMTKHAYDIPIEEMYPQTVKDLFKILGD